MKMKNRRNAMMLIEVIIALAIFGIIMVVFLSMFLSGILGIYGAGDKGVAFNLAQEDLDSRIASGADIDALPLTVEFGSNAFIIEGGFVDASKFYRNKTSDLEAFIPILPRIQITPNTHFEGSAVPFTITAEGTNTHFTASTKVEVLTRVGAVKESINTITFVDSTHISFEITSNLVNSESDYVLKVFTPRAGLPNEVVRAKFSVNMPNLVAATDKSIYVSENGLNWFKTYDVPFETFGEPNAITYGDKKYLIAGSKGKYLLSSEYHGMAFVTTGSDIAINDVTWSNYYRKFFSVNDFGVISASSTGDVWGNILSSVGVPLRAISITEAGRILAVGDNNKVYYSTNSTTWAEGTITSTSTITFNDVFAFDDGIAPYYFVIGNSGAMYESTDGLAWNVRNEATNNLKSIEHYLGTLIVVGDGLIMTSTDRGVSWPSKIVETTSFVGSAFLAGTDSIFVVGESTMKKSTDFATWSIVNTLSGEIYKAITYK